MEAQTTPTHDNLWHKGFWALAVANILLTTAVYMMAAEAVEWLGTQAMSAGLRGTVMGAYAIGLFLLGPSCSYLVERYRRNQVCVWAVVALAACLWLFGAMQQHVAAWRLEPAMFALVRMGVGATFGLAQMVLSSTLVIDVCESFQRTRANHVAAWLMRLSLCLGPALTLLMAKLTPDISPYRPMSAMCIMAAALIMLVPIPFRAPSDRYPHFSSDRFLLPLSWPLFLVQTVFAAAVGAVLAQQPPIAFYAAMLGGLALALVEARLVADGGPLRIATTLGFLAMAAVVSLPTGGPTATTVLIGLLAGLATGCVSNHCLSLFLNLSNHCQRATSQSSCFLSWELGIASGLALAFCCPSAPALLAQLLVVAALAFCFLAYPWYQRHRAR